MSKAVLNDRARDSANDVAIFLLNSAGRFSPVASYRSEIDVLCAEIVRRTGAGAEIRLSGNPDSEGMYFVPVRDDVRIEIEGPLGQLNINAEFRDAATSITPLSWTLANPIDLLCLLARILAALDQAALAQHLPRRPCRAPCGEGVVVLDEHGGLGARTEWQAGIDALCSSIRQCVMKATVQFCPYRHGRALALDLVDSDQLITMSISVNPQGNPLDIAPDDLPARSFGDLPQQNVLEFWLANHADCLYLAARVLSALNQGGELAFAVSTPSSSLGPSINFTPAELTSAVRTEEIAIEFEAAGIVSESRCPPAAPRGAM